MFDLHYFWFFVVASYLTSSVARYAASEVEGANPLIRLAAVVIGPACVVALLVFLIIGFWKMPSWWMPLVMLLIGALVAWLPGNDSPLVLLLGLPFAPILTLLAYLGLFRII